MSDAVRNWSSTAGRPTRKRRRRGFFRWIILALIPLTLLWAWATTRDTHTIASLVPADQAYEVYLNSPLQQRHRLAESELWNLIPPGFELPDVREQLSADIGVPDWVLNNFLPGACLITGNEIETFDDALVISHMTRVGCLIEKGRGFVSGITIDPAGGLDLCHVADAGLWYAVRGRVLLATRSRTALIHALTLTEDDAQTAERLAAGYARAREALVFARMHWDDSNEGPGKWLSSAEGTLQLSAQGGELHGVLSPARDLREQLNPILSAARPVDLDPPLDGLVSIAADFGQPLGALWPMLEEVAGSPGALRTLATDLGSDPQLNTLVADVLADAGPTLRLAWLGVDTLEMFPTPELVLTASDDVARLRELIAPLPLRAVAGNVDDAFWPVYSESEQILSIPLIGGPSIEPTFAVWDGGLLLSSSRTRATALAETTPPRNSPGTGNLYIAVHPAPIVDTLAKTGHEFVVIGALRGHTPESLEASMAPWRTWAQIVQKISLLASNTGDGAIDVTLAVRLAGQ